MHSYDLVCNVCEEITGSGSCHDLQRAADSNALSTCSNGHRAIVLVAGKDAYTPTPLTEAPRKEDHVKATEDALAAAKSARTVVSALSVVERLNERLAALESKIGL